jgi:tetratricopeptide (TPR) repeat protein
MGDGIDFGEVMRMRNLLRAAIAAIAEKPTDDSPVYTFLSGLKPPIREIAKTVAATGAAGPTSPAAMAASDQSASVVSLAVQAHRETQRSEAAGNDGGADNPTISSLMQDAQSAIDNSEFATARDILTRVKQKAPRDSYVTQKLAMATYKCEQPTPLEALRAAEGILRELAKDDSNDTETLGLWGSIHKRLWELDSHPGDLDTALAAYQKAFVLKNDIWNGINLAFLYTERAAQAAEPDDAEADRVMAKHTRRKVLEICQPLYQGNPVSTVKDRYWLLATMAEAWVGLGDEAQASQFMEEANSQLPARWMRETTAKQMDRLRKLLLPQKRINSED